MAIRKIVKIGDETLRKVCRKQEKFDLRLAVLLKDMADTMYKAEGVGLAAPQVGILRRVVVVDVSPDRSGLREMVNPVILERDGSQTGREGCLSVPERQGVVTRPMKVTVTVSPILWPRMARIRASAEVMGVSSTRVMMSPFSRPASSAGLPEVTSDT